MGRDTSFTYTLDVEFADTDAGIAQIRIDVPAPAVLEEITGLEGSAIEVWDSTRDQLTISLAEPLRQDAQLQIRFRTRTHATIHAFRARLFAPNSDNPLNAARTRLLTRRAMHLIRGCCRLRPRRSGRSLKCASPAGLQPQ